MTLPDFAFAAFAAITLIGAVLAVSLKNVFYNAMSLILCLFGVAAMFVFLNGEFLAVVEIIVYIGAISIAIIFAIMLSRPMKAETEPADGLKTFRSGVLALALFILLAYALGHAAWPLASEEGNYSMDLIGRTLLSTQALPFEVISLILLIAIIGALVISGSKENA